MPGCSAVGCKNRSEHGYRMFLLPQGARNEARRNQWILNIGRSDLPSRSVVCEVHFTNNQFENNRRDNKRFLRWNAVPTIFESSEETAGVRRSQRKRTIIKEEHLEWPPVKVSTADSYKSGTPTKTKRGKSFDVEETKAVSNGVFKKGRRKKLSQIKVKREPVDECDEFVNRTIKHRSKHRKLFDEEGYLMETNEERPLQDVECNEHEADLENTVEDVTVDSQSNIDSSSDLPEVIEHNDTNINYKRAKETVNQSALDESLCSSSIANDVSTSKRDSTSKATIQNVRFEGVNLLTSTSKLEDFAEIISEERHPKSRLSILDHKKKSAVKRVVRVSTDNICRICGKLSDSLLSIYSDNARRRHVPVYIDQYLPIKVSETDPGWPKNICELCVKCLTEWDGLYGKCKQVDAMFGKLLNRPPCKTSSKAHHIGRHHDEIQRSILRPNSHIDHNYCPKGNGKIVCEDASPGKLVGNTSSHSKVAVTKTSKRSIVEEHVNENSAIEKMNEDSENLLLLSNCVDSNKENLESLQVENVNQVSGNDIVSDGGQTNTAKQQYKIGITLVKNKDCNEGTELDFSSLKSILISKVNQLFQSICSDKTIGKSVVCRNRSDPMDGCSSADDVSVTEDEDGLVDTSVLTGVERCVSDANIPEGIKTDKTIRRRKASQHSPSSKKRRMVVPDETGSYLCSDCGSMISERKSFLTHRRMYHTEKKCHYCNVTLPSLHEYRRHLRVSHLDKISNSCCEICGATFIRRERLQRHKLIIHNIGEYVYCNICNKKCASRQQLYCHKSDAHNKIKNLCHHCGQNFASHQSFLAHLKKKHSYRKNLSCINCDKTFNTRANLETHIEKCQRESHLSEEPPVKISPKLLSANSKLYTCLICSVKITDVEMLKQHMNYHANDDSVKNLVSQETKSDYDCMLCGIYLSSERDLALHRFYAHQEAPFICRVSDCNVSFWKRMSLIMHQMTVHKMPNNTCKICSKSFTDYKEKRHHTKTHHSNRGPQDKPYACMVCNRRFCWKSTLKTHMVIHSDVKMYKCNLCAKEFKLKLTLSKHMQYHQRKQLLEEEVGTCEVQEVTEVAEVTEVTTVADISGVAEHIGTETGPKELFTVSSDDQGLTVMNTAGLLKICTVFKCPDCNILFTHKETRDSHYLEEHTDKQTVNYEIADVINVNLHESEFV